MKNIPQIKARSNPASGPDGPPGSLCEEELLAQTRQLSETIIAAVRAGTAVHEVELEIWRRLSSLGRKALSLFFQSTGSGDMGEQVALPDGRLVRRLPELHKRPYQSIFGPFILQRTVYGSREGQKIELVPLDQRLGLPAGSFSYALQDWDQYQAMESPYARVSDVSNRFLGFSQSVDSLERMNRTMAEPVVDYWDSLGPPPAAEEGQVVVVSADGKGVPMRRSADQIPDTGPAPRKGPAPGSKKMALLGTAYTVELQVRSPEDIVKSLFGEKSEAGRSANDNRPKPQHKRLRASLQRSEEGTTEPAVQEIFGWMSMEVEQRNRQGEKPMVILMDGQKSLWDAAEEHLPDGGIPILDLLHVTSRLWKAANILNRKGSSEAVEFVKDRTLRILRGEVSSVIRGLRRQATLRKMSPKKRKKLRRTCNYLDNNRDRMRYNEYLAAGYPIATGVIEGACRHLVKDRLERAGMLWTMSGAQAMLDLRCIYLSGHWDAFKEFRIQTERERLYPHPELTDNVEWPIAA